MPEYLAVRCVECGRYQVQQRRKDGRFRCPACGARQSVQAVAGVADKAKPLRELVQRLNKAEGGRLELAEARARAATTGLRSGDGTGALGAQKRPARPAPDWSAYLGPEEPEPDGEEAEALQPQGPGGRYVAALPATARKRARATPKPQAPPSRGRQQPLQPLQPLLLPLQPPRQQQPRRAGGAAAPAASGKWNSYLSAEEEGGGGGGGGESGREAEAAAARGAWADPAPPAPVRAGLFVTELPRSERDQPLQGRGGE